MPTTKHYPLNAKQIHTLKLIYKFRFINSTLLAKYKGINRINTHKALKILLDQEYIARDYRSEYRIDRIGAKYYLAPKALRLLKDEHQLNEKTLLNMYKNKNVSSVFADHNIDVMQIYLSLRDAYSTTFHMFTKSELGDYTYFPEPKPDLYLNRIKPRVKLASEYILYIFTVTPPYIIKKQIEALVEHYDTDDWQTESETDYPVILIAC